MPPIRLFRFTTLLARPVGQHPRLPSPLHLSRTTFTPKIYARPPRRFNGQTPYNPTPNLTSPTASLSFSQRMRKLSREYGWAAFGVYLALTALDFPFCFIAVRSLGTERIGHWEHAVIEWVKRAVPIRMPEGWFGGQNGEAGEVLEQVGDKVVGYDHGVREAEKENSGDNASIWTQLALAYAIHKCFIFIRVPLTAAVTPKVVKTLRGWGWNIGKRRPKDERIAAKAAKKALKEGGK